MVITQAILAAVARSAGKLLNTVLGWATTTFFGKVPEDRQIYLSVLAFGSMVWLLFIVGILFPAAGVFLLSFVPLPRWVDRDWVRLFMLGAGVVLPGLLGIVSLNTVEPSARPRDFKGKLRAIIKGYPFTLGLAATLVLMVLFAPVLKAKAITRRWTTAHIPAIVDPGDYAEVVDQIQSALEGAGWATTREEASWMLRLPTQLLTRLGGSATASLVAESLTTLRSLRLEVTLHPADLVVSGKVGDVSRARAVIAEGLFFTPAHLTWTKEANEIEDRLEELWTEVAQSDRALPEQLGTYGRIELDLKRLEIAYEEWEVLFRQALLVERTILNSMFDGRVPDPNPNGVRSNVQGAGNGHPGGSRVHSEGADILSTAAVLLTASTRAWLENRKVRA